MELFNNTKVAFQYKSKHELKKAYFLFKIISKPWNVNNVNWLINILLSMNIPVGWIVKATVYSHFVGGETLEKCSITVEKLNNYNVKSILDCSVEGK